ncbi:alpha/beta hydrolase [Antrihabitans cavernicola]|uniref:Esterase family protein n=1 Tax=Antrihabitans cavernicola TaxID=2495913 RepID=A0A5A7SHW0_9NOCA|nr:alpha/beta hydrolase family protein [Spelaeibacter cavernicola]KAA0024949.1 esterase family protein [Spelaeibacter cavernicola]
MMLAQNVKHRTVAMLLGLLTATAFAVTLPAQASARGVSIDYDRGLGGSASEIGVYSPAMNKVIKNRVLHAAGGPAPTLYLLTGLGGGEDNISWWDDTDVRAFFAGKHVNVVMPVGGRSSMYTDWNADDPVLGRNKWQTYLTRELPGLIDGHLGATGANAIAGVSMAAGPALDLAIQAPDVYRAVGSYSGCAKTSDIPGATAVSTIVGLGGGNPINMWGVPSSPQWVAHDPYVNAQRLAGKAIYISAATGIPGSIDKNGFPNPPVEALSAVCTGLFASRLAQFGIPAKYVLHPRGAHTWGLWEDDLRQSWPVIAGAIGA